ncbi:MAG: ferrous iron transport protein B [Planctomycetota bacterium]
MSAAAPDAAAAPTRIAVIGNPNTGKTTLFNALTGMALRVGNYPGVTVDRKEGTLALGSQQVTLVDLPGTYSLAARSPDEMVAVDELLQQQSEVEPVQGVIAVVDAANLERNLYLVTQLFETALPVLVVLNRIDLAASQGITVDGAALAAKLGLPLVATNARSGEGLDELRTAIATLAAAIATGTPVEPPAGPEFPEPFTAGVAAFADWLNAEPQRGAIGRAVPRFEAMRAVVDSGGHAEARLSGLLGEGFAQRVAEARRDAGGGRPPIASEAQARYGWIRERIAGTVTKPETPMRTRTDTVDAILTHRVFGLVFLVVILGVVFQAIYTGAGPFMDGVEWVVGGAGAIVGGWLGDGILHDFVVDAIVGGVGSVVVFLPQIIFLFLFIAVLEDCGYMARAAFLLDRMLSFLGLSGKSVVPMLSSFACAIPGVMAARTIENRRDRLATILVAPLMSCSARLPVYTVLIGAFVPAVPIAGGLFGAQGFTLLAMHFLGVIVAVPVLFILKRTLLKGETPPFVMELPPYTWPAWRTVFRRVYDRSWSFLKRAGTIIFAVTVVVWLLGYFPQNPAIAQRAAEQATAARAELQGEALDVRLAEIEQVAAGEHVRQSIFGRMGQAVEPLGKPLGWDWRISMAAIASFPAREVVIGTLGTIYNLGPEVDEETEGLPSALKSATWPDGTKVFNLPVALGLMVFFALCAQCGATLAVIKREAGGWGWALFTFVYMTALAYIGAFITYQVTFAIGW